MVCKARLGAILSKITEIINKNKYFTLNHYYKAIKVSLMIFIAFIICNKKCATLFITAKLRIYCIDVK
jgi:hypothetical protein